MLGAYGLRIEGLPGAERWMQPQEPAAPVLRVEVRQAAAAEEPSRVDDRSADIRLVGGGRLRASCEEPVVRFDFVDVPPDADLLHPYLTPGAALVWQWAGREALHAGAVAIGGAAVLVIGRKEAGKSTTLAWLAEHHDAPVMADDLAVIQGDRVVAGPRSIDLRTEAAVPGAVVVREGDRRRVTLPAVPASLPIAGSVVLGWGERPAIEPLDAEARLRALASERTFHRLRGDPAAILDIAARPMFGLSRPRTTGVAATAQLLLDRFS